MLKPEGGDAQWDSMAYKKKNCDLSITNEAKWEMCVLRNSVHGRSRVRKIRAIRSMLVFVTLK